MSNVEESRSNLAEVFGIFCILAASAFCFYDNPTLARAASITMALSAALTALWVRRNFWTVIEVAGIAGVVAPMALGFFFAYCSWLAFSTT